MLLETPNDMAYEVAKRVRKLRRSRKVTIRSLSERSGVPYSTLRRFESTGEIAFVSLVKIASVLGEDDQIRNLFANPYPQSMEEVLRANRL
jgi:transcriptional regulator with XRE-family HTH domain